MNRIQQASDFIYIASYYQRGCIWIKDSFNKGSLVKNIKNNDFYNLIIQYK